MQRTRITYLMLIPLLAAACKGKQQPAGGPMPRPAVTVYEVKSASHVVTESFPATLIGNMIVDIRSDVTGYLEAIHAKDGSTVKKGQVLYEVDKSRSQASYDQANASVLQAEADLAQKKQDYERYANLLKQDAISRQTVDQSLTAVKTAEAILAAAKASRARTGTDISHAVLRAPMNGKIGIAMLRIGDLVTAGSTTINTLVNEDPIYADIDIPQSRYAEFVGNMKKDPGGVKYFIAFPNGGVYPQEGKVLLINNIVDPKTGTLRVRLSFPNKEETLKSGMTAIVQIRYHTDNQIAIPSKAIVELLGEVKAYTVDNHNVVQSVPIEKGPIVDSLMIINKGLQAGQRIVVDGIQKIKPGDTVTVK
ncbi:efflux RND transporter periplasmic adaptor subunit [Chitinophaga sp. GCM10012297]|uniref:Efflux RND transporter periplasmic adaptor subunit n=1 Tax=Chitinophaga chungangae TaxID=2821488 RepID=A0ABS3YJG7_9BACT|nr:efflux RND transporter periplasmic adaptor subunit [Chitinophaga chungangae]MBO9154829.1 efflux RND transporter periplasmic adaptor subunit [Chitinophaga chungangae]